MIGDLIAILITVCVLFLFWQQRRQSEIAKAYITQRCEQHDLQLLSIARGKYRFKATLPFTIMTEYHFEFSVNGTHCYQGLAVMHGLQLQHVQIPPYPIN
ncbi:MAG: DUF3301 domain-containing protein [Enterovibrio sp.]